MKKTINVNLNGRVFTMDEDAYQLLEKYLRNLRIYFRKEEGAAEIIADFEARIEELFNEKLRKGYQVIPVAFVEEVIARVGKPDEFSESEKTEDRKQSFNPEFNETKKKFFRDSDDKIIGGICSGLSVYFGWDVLPIRIVFFILIFVSYFSIIPAYLLAWIFLPEAKTTEQKLQMHGKPVSVENIGKAVAAEVENFIEKNRTGGFAESFIRLIGALLKACLIGLACLIGIPLLFALIVALIALFAVLFGASGEFLSLLTGNTALLSVSHPVLAAATFIILLVIPLTVLIYGVIAYFGKPKPLNVGVKWAGFLVWIAALVLFFCSGFRINRDFIPNASLRTWLRTNDIIIEGNGILSEKECFIAPIEAIAVEGNLFARLQIEQTTGDSVSILMSGDENLIDKVKYELKENKLCLSVSDNYRIRTNNNLVIRIQTPSLSKFTAHAIGDVCINRTFRSEEFQIKMEGAGNFRADSLIVLKLKAESDGICSIRLSGIAGQAKFNMEGIGEINALELVSDTVYADVSGIGTIKCNPVDYLKGAVAGIGTIKYKNEPKSKDCRTVGIGRIAGQE